MAIMSYAQAIRMVIEQEMKRDEHVFCMGEDCEKLGGVFGHTGDQTADILLLLVIGQRVIDTAFR